MATRTEANGVENKYIHRIWQGDKPKGKTKAEPPCTGLQPLSETPATLWSDLPSHPERRHSQSEWVGHSVSQWVETYKVFVEISFITLSSRTECCLFLLLFLQLRSTKGGGSEWGVEWFFFSWFDACVSLWPDSFTLIPYPTPYTPHRRKDRALLSRWTTYR